jgi:hypothetical protein
MHRVGIYWNLKTGGFSMCLLKSDKTRGPVVAHCEAVDLQNVRLVVSEGGRLRSVAKYKEVHAWLAGDLQAFTGTLTEAGKAAGLESSPLASPPAGERIRYNPHRAATFTRDSDASPIHEATRATCRMDSDGRAVLLAHN